ncbi:serine hydroxymethyltransferase, cytosolic [Acanthochromis polyacanthus]|uniref:serine hydroxymethyltransferase, cytosolic n=1 Tax=Acanthochromis polyacanthus TaxID=80966 RepID=UPI002234500D|nr:serine hydroxymethyltransferase, cytosolic [Acanthochromis polyacanthus]
MTEASANTVNPETGYIDYDRLQENARLFHPKLIIAGASCYSRNLDYARLKQIADENGGSDNHLILLDLRSKGTDGGRAEKVLEACAIACNKNTCPGDKSALRPSGLRFGSPALTSRGLVQDDFRKVAELIHRAIELTLEIQRSMDPKATLKEFIQTLAQGEKFQQRVAELRAEVEAFTGQFPMPGLPEL